MIGNFYTDKMINPHLAKETVRKGDKGFEDAVKRSKECYIFSPNWVEQEDGSYEKTANGLWNVLIWMRNVGVPVINAFTIDEFVTRMKLERRLFNYEEMKDEEAVREYFLQYSGLYTAVEGMSRTQYLLECTSRLATETWGDNLGIPSRLSPEWRHRPYVSLTKLPKRDLVDLCLHNWQTYRTSKEACSELTKEDLNASYYNGRANLCLRVEEVGWFRHKDKRYYKTKEKGEEK